METLVFKPIFRDCIHETGFPLCTTSVKLYVVSHGWPCWLALALALWLLLVRVFFPRAFHDLFLSLGWNTGISIWEDVGGFWELNMFPPDVTVFALGPIKFLTEVQSKLSYHWGGFVFAIDVPFDQCRLRDLYRRYNCWAIKHVCFGLSSTTVSQADFGSVTLACHYLCFHFILSKRKVGVPCVPWTLLHILIAAKKSDGWGWWTKIDPPAPLVGTVPRAPIMVNDLLWHEGLYEIHLPSTEIAQPCVFKSTGWTKGGLSASKLMHAFNTPLALFCLILEGNRLPLCSLACSLSPRVVTAIFNTIWCESYRGGG
jgi:hypothetical protein